MSNSSTASGQLQRAGVSTFSLQTTRRKKRKLLASRIREATGNPFVEQGKDEKASKGTPKNRVYLVTIIEEGLGNSKDKNYYSGDALRNGVNVFNGSKAYADHPDAISEKTLPERSMKDLVGWYSDCFTDKNPQTGKIRLRGKLHFFPSAKWLTDMIDTILKDPSAKNLFGISINAIGKTRPATMQGEEVNFVEEFQRVDSADVVTEPAARGKFDQMLESRKGRSGSKVSSGMKRNIRTREAGALSSEKAKDIADSLVSAYNSDNPDEAKQAMFEAAKVLHAAASISGKGPGQVNEEQYSNINPSGGSEDMAKGRVIASSGDRRPLRFRKRKALRASDGTSHDNENMPEPSPSDIEDRLEEHDVEDEEGRGDLGDQAEHGSSRYHQVKASRRGRVVARAQEDEDEGFEDEGLEDEDEGFEDEAFEDEDEGGEDENVGQMPGGSASPGASTGAPMGGGAPGSSRAVAAEADDDDDDDGDDDDDDDMDDMDESDEDEHDMMRPSSVAESRGRRGRRREREAGPHHHSGSSQGQTVSDASFAGGLGHSGHTALPTGADDTKGYDTRDRDEDYGKKDDSTSGVGKSYKIKTSRFARNRKARRFARPIVREANRRIGILEDTVRRLRESLNKKENKLVHYKGKLRFMESDRTATSLLREAVKKEILPVGLANAIRNDLIGLSRDEQIRIIKRNAHLLEAATNESISRLTESVDGNGARGAVVSWGPGADADSELVSALADEGVPIKQEQ